MRNAKSSRRNNAKISPPTTVCYCDGKRELGTVEIICSQCMKWFHARCLKECSELQNSGVPFMICYNFVCKECRPTSEDWKPKKAELVHMCVTVFASMTAQKLTADGSLSSESNPEEYTYFSLKEKIIPHMEVNWNMLTSIKKKATWHQNLAATLLKEKNLFAQHPEDPDLFALAEKNLAQLGPLHEAVKQIGKKPPVEKSSKEDRVVELPPIEGPKTRGASKRKNVEGAAPGKKQKLASDYSSTAIAGNQIDIPFSKDGYRYFYTERDPNHIEMPREIKDEKAAYVIPPEQHRIVCQPAVSVSSNDRAYQLFLETNNLPIGTTWSVTGHEGYSMARATHGVAKGTWYYEVKFDEQPDDSHIRIGWGQPYAPLQACVGYNKFSYGWRSKHGTKFHDGIGKHYKTNGFKQGDILGCLIHLPVDEKTGVPSISSEEFLPPSHKNATLISFKNNLFFEVYDDAQTKLKTLSVLKGSRIEFFLNGKSCGTAYEDIYKGYYFPSVSLYHKAKISVNFGPKLEHLPPGATAMCNRAEEQQFEQTLSDVIHLVCLQN